MGPPPLDTRGITGQPDCKALTAALAVLDDTKGLVHRSAIVRALFGVDVLHAPADEEGRRAVAAFFVPGGGIVHVRGARAVREEWRVRPMVLAGRIAECSSRARVLLGETGPSLAPEGCGARWCPSCAAHEVAQSGAVLAGEIEGLAAGGCAIAHATLTIGHPTEGPQTIVLSEDDRSAGWAAPGHEGPSGVASLGDPLANQLRDLLGAWRRVTHDGAGARWWRRHVAGAVYRWEATGYDPRQAQRDGYRVPRWHGHLHVLLVLRPGVNVRGNGKGKWWAALRRLWCAAVEGQGRRASSAAQYVRRVEDQGAGLRAAIAETVKYPVKPWDVTRAQLLEAAAVTVGRRSGYRMGVLHGGTNARKQVDRAVREGLPVSEWLQGLAACLHERADHPAPVAVWRRPNRVEGGGKPSVGLPWHGKEPSDGDAESTPWLRVFRPDPAEIAPWPVPWVPLRAGWLAEEPPESEVRIGWRTPDGVWNVRSFKVADCQEWALNALNAVHAGKTPHGGRDPCLRSQGGQSSPTAGAPFG